DLGIAVDVGDLVGRTVAGGDRRDHLGLALAGLLGQLRAQVFLGIVEGVLDQGGIGAGQRPAQLFQVLRDRGRQRVAVHGRVPSRTASTESRVARQAAAQSRRAASPAPVMR